MTTSGVLQNAAPHSFIQKAKLKEMMNQWHAPKGCTRMELAPPIQGRRRYRPLLAFRFHNKKNLRTAFCIYPLSMLQ